MFQKWVNEVGQNGWKSTDNEETKLNKTITTIVAVIVGYAAVLWGVSYWLLDLKFSALLPIFY